MSNKMKIKDAMRVSRSINTRVRNLESLAEGKIGARRFGEFNHNMEMADNVADAIQTAMFKLQRISHAIDESFVEIDL